jgi:NTP pyrophosphatase (non-canonical NTP hydrolase)
VNRHPRRAISNLKRSLTLPTDENTTVAQLRQKVAAFVRERDWEQFHDPKNLSMAIATEAAELMEHFRWVTNEGSDRLANESGQRNAIAEELADILAFVLSLANRCNLDLSRTLEAKMAKNAAKYPADRYQGRY